MGVTLQVLWPHCVWVSIEANVPVFAKLHGRQDEKASTSPVGCSRWCRHMGEVFHVDFLHLVMSAPLGAEGLASAHAQHLVVLTDNPSRYALMEPAAACTAEKTVLVLLRWCAAIRVPRV